MVDVYWRIGMHGDQSTLRRRAETRGDWAPLAPGNLAPGWGDGQGDGRPYLEHMADVARAAEISGFVGGLMPSFPFTDDPFAAAASLIEETRTFRFMVAFQPGFVHPWGAARLSAALQQLSGGRLVYNVITGGGGPAQRWWGDAVEHDRRYARTAEFLDLHRRAWTAQPQDADGEFYRLADARLPVDLAEQPFPEIYFSGSSPAAIAAAGPFADYYLSWLEPQAALTEKFAAVRAASQALGRTPKFAVRIDIVSRDTEAEAWEVVRDGFSDVDLTALAEGRQGDSVGVARARSFIDGPVRDVRDLEVEPHVWGGFSLLRGGPSFGLVGSHEQVAERLNGLIDAGVDAFILAGVPHLEEAFRVGDFVLPRLTYHSPQGALS